MSETELILCWKPPDCLNASGSMSSSGAALAFQPTQSRSWSSALAYVVLPQLTPRLSCGVEVMVVGGLRRTRRTTYQKEPVGYCSRFLPISLFFLRAVKAIINTSCKMYI